MNKFLRCTLAYLGILGCLGSCQKALNTGDDLLPDDDNISIVFNDTTTLKTSTVRSNPVRTDRLLFNHLGCMEDPIFGSTKANVSFELGLPIVGLEENILRPYTIDSVVLGVVVNDFFGDSSQPQYFQVYQKSILEEKLIDYYSNEPPITDVNPIGTLGPVIPTLAPNIRIDASGDTSSTNPILSFKLDESVGALILNNLGNIESFSDLENLLPGLTISVDSTQSCGGGLYLLNLLSLNSNLKIHYRNSANDTLVMSFPTFNSGFTRAEYNHNYNATDVEESLNDASDNQELSYVQGLAGVQTKIDLPFIMAYSGSAVNKAEIEVVQIYDEASEIYRTPERLYVTSRDNQGLIRNISDFSFGDAYYGGFRDSLTDENNNKIYKYVINVSAHMQEVFDGKEDNSSLYLTTLPEQIYDGGSANLSVLLPDRIIVGGGANSVDNSQIKLNLKYTNIE